MSEVLTRPPEAGASTEVHTPQAEQAGRFERIRELGARAYTLLELSAGISNRNHRLEHANRVADTINQYHEGLIGRQAHGETVGMFVEEDIRITFRRDVLRAGHANPDAMPAEQRRAVAEAAARAHRDDIVAELHTQHPDWAAGQIMAAAEARIADVVTILSMDSATHDEYEADLFTYQEQRARITELIAERAELETEHSARVRNIGRAALQGLVGMARAVRNVPGAVRRMPSVINATGTVVFMSARTNMREWYGSRTGEQKKLMWLTAASVAFAGIASFIAARYGLGTGGHGTGSQPNMEFASYSKPEGEPIGTEYQPSGEPIGATYGEPIGAGSGEPIGAGANPGETIGAGYTPGESIGGDPSVGEPIGSEGATAGEPIGTEAGEPIGGEAQPGETIGADPSAGAETATGIDLSHATTTKELFSGTEQVKTWPQTVTVDRWNPKTKQGSLWGICDTMLQRSGIANPSDDQINQLVDTLRPQAQPNGFLDEGQTLDLTPAIEELSLIA